MAKVPKSAPRGRTRRAAGAGLVVLGAVLVARVGWLGAVYGSAFGQDEWVRFGFWLGMGVVLALLGSWLRYRLRAAAWVAVLVVVALFVSAFIYDCWLR